MRHRTSYAQNREDLIIAAFFPDITAGHYVDVGAGDPVSLSVTKHFYDRGWTGLNIEPIPELARALANARPNDVTLAVGVSDSNGRSVFRQYQGIGLSTLSTAIFAEHEGAANPLAEAFDEYEISVETLGSILREHPLPHLHFLKIDCEGSEFEVLAGNDWDVFRPELICIEADKILRDWRPVLEEARYVMVFDDGLNHYYLAAEAAHRAQNFTYASAILEGPPILTADMSEAFAEHERAVASLRGQVESLIEHLALNTRTISALHDQVSDFATRIAAGHDHAAQLQQQNARLTAEVERLARGLDERTHAVDQLNDQVSELIGQAGEYVDEISALDGKVSRLENDRSRLQSVVADRDAELYEAFTSRSWRVTAPIRRMTETLGLANNRGPGASATRPKPTIRILQGVRAVVLESTPLRRAAVAAMSKSATARNLATVTSPNAVLPSDPLTDDGLTPDAHRALDDLYLIRDSLGTP